MARPASANRTHRATLLLASVAVVSFILVALFWAQAIFIPLAMAVFVSFILTPPVTWLQRRGLGRIPSVVIVVGLSLLTTGVVGYVVGRQMMQLTNTLPDYSGRIQEKLKTIKGWVVSDEKSRLGELIEDVTETFTGPKPDPMTTGKDQQVVVNSAPSWTTRAQAVASPAVEVLGQLAFTFILVVFMLLKREDLRNRVIRLVGHGDVTTTTRAVDEVSQRISRYLAAQFVLNAAFGLVIAAALFAMQVPYGPLWGFTAFLMRYVPYIGTWIGVLPPAVFTFAVSDGWGLTIGVLVLFLGLELICNNFLEPWLYGKRLGLSEVAQLVATAFWAFLWGPVGMILAGPLTTCLLVLGKYVPQLQFLNILLGDEPVLSSAVAFYQRLAARDTDEAADILEAEMKLEPADKVFDKLLVPALIEARKAVGDSRASDEDYAAVLGAVREISEEVTEPATPAAAPTESRARLLLVPAKDPADHVAAEVFVRLLDPSLWQAEVAGTGILTSELLARIDEFKPGMVVITSLPPGGLTHTKFLVKRLRLAQPTLKIVVARWSPNAEEKLIESFKEAGADEGVLTMEKARALAGGWLGVFVAESKSSAKPKVGTGSASK